jgi:hypothetical protein
MNTLIRHHPLALTFPSERMGLTVRRSFSTLYASLGNLYHERREARRALLACGAPAPEYDATEIDCQCSRCHRPTSTAITFRFNRAGDPVDHELLPATSHCPDCGLPLHDRNLQYIPPGLPVSAVETPGDVVGETSSAEKCVVQTTVTIG